MNDPGLDPSIAVAASQADRNEQSDPSNGEADESETYLHWAAEDRELAQFLQPARWWIASTEIPLLAVGEPSKMSCLLC